MRAYITSAFIAAGLFVTSSAYAAEIIVSPLNELSTDNILCAMLSMLFR